ncbi:SGNH/GDSL hydrolase family protein [Virgisporangium aurantiacum]|uniref:SGNH hydrolase n=1 Tax=Virgisporangium aurantiacum TaxID=175570 RepID=A0A8J3Z0J3_9ACTN|nr:SGNH/GDSL hydrolase family protein [Virgisporangium aurantiacum]GIJ54227.1 SGNH hydrolase [Virgisporangium aurantiacum]
MSITVVTQAPVTGPPRRIRFAALGDSTTVGIGDPMPDGTWRGWAQLLASALSGPADVELHNLAASGARADDVADGQLTAALRLRPDIASVLVGANDTLRGRFDVAAIGHALGRCVAMLRQQGAVVLTARLPEPGRMLRLPASLARPLGRRIGAINEMTDAIAARFGTVHADLARLPAVYDRPMWSIDRLHPSERGHRLLARCFADALGADGYPVASLPALEPEHAEPTRSARAGWMLTKGTRWILHRCADLVPGLTAMVAAEWWFGVRGMANRFDEHVGNEVAAALARIEPCVPVASFDVHHTAGGTE